jgi:hypothetical protein
MHAQDFLLFSEKVSLKKLIKFKPNKHGQASYPSYDFIFYEII